MNKNQKKLILKVVGFIILILYSTWLPLEIVIYGTANGWEGFLPTTPISEAYPVFTLAWLGGHMLIAVGGLCVWYPIYTFIKLGKKKIR